MHRDLMEHWIAILQRVERERAPFSMQEWFVGLPDDCGLAACAGGLAARDQRFQKRGLWPTSYGSICFGRWYGVAAIQAFFGITWRASCYITLPTFYDKTPILPSHVIQHIRAVISNNGKAPGEA